MAIEDTQVPIHKHTILVFFFFNEKQNKAKLKTNKQKYVKPQTSQFCYAEAHRCYSILVGFSGEMVIYAFFLGFFSHSRQKEWYKC